MKSEALAVLRLLERGIITADEAERLLEKLGNLDKSERLSKEEIKADIQAKLRTAGEALGNIAKKAGETAETAAKELEPIIKKVADTVYEKTGDLKTYMDKKTKENTGGTKGEDFQYWDAPEECCKSVEEEPVSGDKDDFEDLTKKED